MTTIHDLIHQPGILTDAEREATTLAAAGLSTRAIALALGISRSAVRSRLENSQRKLQQAKDAA